MNLQIRSHFFWSFVLKAITFFCTVILILAGLSSCVSVPKASGEGKKSAFVITSPSQEKKMGEQAFRQILEKEKLSTNTRLTTMLERVGQRIAAVSGVDFDWQFKLIESREMNAFCLPGGKVAFYTGILPVLENEAGMAVVMGHEVAHATLRHGAQRMAQGMATQIGLLGASLILGTKGENSEANQWLALMGAGATVGILLPFSRSHELESDELGLRYAAQAGYDPSEGPRLWQRFSAAKGGKGPPSFLSTHPSDQNRIKKLQALQEQLQPVYQNSPGYGLGEKI